MMSFTVWRVSDSVGHVANLASRMSELTAARRAQLALLREREEALQHDIAALTVRFQAAQAKQKQPEPQEEPQGDVDALDAITERAEQLLSMMQGAER
eukprot:1715014-Prymnesium_polylepis.1